jgi:hypothetical protein
VEFPKEQTDALKRHCDALKRVEEGGIAYLLMEGFRLPEGCEPQVTDALLCPTERDGYASRLFFKERVTGRKTPNWNTTGVRIAERNWEAYSYRTSRPNLTLEEMLVAHLRGLV